MGKIMTLNDVVGSIDTFDVEATIYAVEPWIKGSMALVEHEPKAGGLPTEASAQGMKYFLEVFVARDFLEDWKSSLGKEPTHDQIIERLIHYAIHDA